MISLENKQDISDRSIIILCAKSNTAVVVMMEKILYYMNECNLSWKIKYVATKKQQEANPKYKEYYDFEGQYNILISTMCLLGRKNIDCSHCFALIMDEASQLREFEMVVPLSVNPKILIMVGGFYNIQIVLIINIRYLSITAPFQIQCPFNG